TKPLEDVTSGRVTCGDAKDDAKDATTTTPTKHVSAANVAKLERPRVWAESVFFGPSYLSVMDGPNVCPAKGMGDMTANDGSASTIAVSPSGSSDNGDTAHRSPSSMTDSAPSMDATPPPSVSAASSPSGSPTSANSGAMICNGSGKKSE
ncbi:unnamed protein product, partial [Laminaria digitata]